MRMADMDRTYATRKRKFVVAPFMARWKRAMPSQRPQSVATV